MPPSTDVAPFVRFYSISSSSDPDFSPSSSPIHRQRRRPDPPIPNFCFMSAASSFLRSLFPALRTACSWLRTPSLSLIPTPPSSPRNRLTITFFGHRKGRISFAVQETPRSHPLLLLELATPTSHLIKEMASGMVRILLESEHGKVKRTLWEEPLWSMYCNGQRCGYSVARECTPADAKLLSAVSAVSVGAGVMSVAPATPALPSTEDGGDAACFSRSGSRSGGGGGGDGEVMYMRARFERVVGSKDSEALYMMNPDGGGRGEGGSGWNSGGGPELSIFLLRV